MPGERGLLIGRWVTMEKRAEAMKERKNDKGNVLKKNVSTYLHMAIHVSIGNQASVVGYENIKFFETI